MKQIDLDDLPPRAAKALTGLQEGEELVITRNGLVVGRLVAQAGEAATAGGSEPPDEEGMKEVMEQFSAMIHDEF